MTVIMSFFLSFPSCLVRPGGKLLYSFLWVRVVPVEECDACIDTFSVDHNRLCMKVYHDAYYGRKSKVAANPSHLSILFSVVLCC
jgi:hypothetical protein